MSDCPSVDLPVTRIDSASEAKWREWLRQQADSGLGVSAFCQQRGLRESTFYGWRSKLARRDRHREGPLAFVPVRVSKPTSAGCLEILLDGGHRIRLSGLVDRQMLRDVVVILEGRPC